MQLRNFDLGLLRALDALLMQRNVTHAAARLGVTQQAMSGSLRRLREHFGDPLLIRIGRQFELTPLGLSLREPVREVLLQIGLALEVKSVFEPTLTNRRFRIALSDYASMILLPHFMPILAARAPGIICEFRPIDNFVYRDVEQGELDFCLLPHNWRLYQRTKPRDLQTIDLFTDDFVCAIAIENSTIGNTMSAKDYAAAPHCMVEFGGGVRSMISEAWARAQLDLKIAATATSFAGLLFMVPGTPMIATAQRRLVAAFTPLLPIRAVECPIRIGQLDEALSWNRRYDHDAAHAFLRGLFRDAALAIA